MRAGARGVSSAGAALFELLIAGDLDAIARRAFARASGRNLPLHEALRPAVRTKGPVRPSSRKGAPRLLMLSPALDLTGAPISQVELATGLAARGWLIDVWAKADGPVHRVYDAAELAVQIEPRLTVTQSTPAGYERGVAALADLISRSGADLVYANTVDLFPAIDAARAAGAASVWNIRESEPWRHRLADRHPKVAARALAAFGYPGAVIFVADAAFRTWQKFATDNGSVIYNAPHPRSVRRGDRAAGRAMFGASDDAFVFLSIGALCARKGQIDLAEALSRFDRETLSRIEVVIVGGADDLYARAFERALTADTRRKIRRIGVLENAVDALAGADALVNTSRSEAFPRSFIEAAAAGLPIVAAKVDGAGERLDHGKSALFYTPGDADALARQMSALATDAALGAEIAAGARRALLDAWTFDDMTAAYDAAFTKSLEMHR